MTPSGASPAAATAFHGLGSGAAQTKGRADTRPAFLWIGQPQLPQSELAPAEPTRPEYLTHLPLACSFTGPA